MSIKNKLFYAEITKGYVLKVTIDSLAMCMTRTTFEVTKKGFFYRGADENKFVLFDIAFTQENFKRFVCSKPLKFALNPKHLQKMVRNVKKKDSIIMYIDADKPDDLALAIRPSNSAGSINRVETVYVTITNVTNNEVIALPDGENSGLYLQPIVIDATDFQKMKKMTTVGKIVSVSIQKDNYISFASNMGGICGTKLEYGEVDDEDDEFYEEEFVMSMFSFLMKLPGLCSQMRFYAPTVERYPLKVSMMAGTLGNINVYIKDKHQIEYEDSKRKNL